MTRRRWETGTVFDPDEGEITYVRVLSLDHKICGYCRIEPSHLQDRRRMAIHIRECRQSIRIHRRQLQRN